MVSIFITKSKAVVLTVMLAATVSEAFAWGKEGHEVIALIAQSRLTPKASIGIIKLLAIEPGATMANVASWADDNRNSASAKWHYINFPQTSCKFVPQRDCPNGDCVVMAIKQQTEVLGAIGNDGERLKALKYLIHFVADEHQPMHAGSKDDKGGNTYQIQAFGRGTNLHALWDSGLIYNLRESPEKLAERINRMQMPEEAGNYDPINAAEESCQLVASGIYPNRKVDDQYVRAATRLAELRMLTAGARLAAILNRLFDK